MLDDSADGGNFKPDSWSLELPQDQTVTMTQGVQYQSQVVGDEPVSIKIDFSMSGFAKQGDQVQIFFEDNGEFIGLFRQSTNLECFINEESSLGCAISSYDAMEYPLVEYLLITLP